MVLKLGGKITGRKAKFYGHSITPMEIQKKILIIKHTNKVEHKKGLTQNKRN